MYACMSWCHGMKMKRCRAQLRLVYPASWAPNLFAGTIFDECPFLLPNLVFAAWLEPVRELSMTVR